MTAVIVLRDEDAKALADLLSDIEDTHERQKYMPDYQLYTNIISVLDGKQDTVYDSSMEE